MVWVLSMRLQQEILNCGLGWRSSAGCGSLTLTNWVLMKLFIVFNCSRVKWCQLHFDPHYMCLLQMYNVQQFSIKILQSCFCCSLIGLNHITNWRIFFPLYFQVTGNSCSRLWSTTGRPFKHHPPKKNNPHNKTNKHPNQTLVFYFSCLQYGKLANGLCSERSVCLSLF